MPTSQRDKDLAHKGKAHGANYSLRIVLEARRADIPISRGFALIEQESGFRNVFGHDDSIFQGAGRVTKKKYLDYKAARKRTGQMQGVGPAQLTWWEFQDRADALGGCWVARHNIRVAFEHLGDLLKHHSARDALAIYNAGNARSRQGQDYATSVIRREKKWHSNLS